VKTLDQLGIPNQAHVLSAHRTPDATAKFAREAADRGIRRDDLQAAGGAAHLAGVISAYTVAAVAGGADSVVGPSRFGLAPFDRANAGRHFPLAHWPLALRARRTRRSWLRPFSRFPTRRFAKIFRRFAKSRLKPCSPTKLPK